MLHMRLQFTEVLQRRHVTTLATHSDMKSAAAETTAHEIWDRASNDIGSQSVEVTHPRLLGSTALSRPYSSFLEGPA